MPPSPICCAAGPTIIPRASPARRQRRSRARLDQCQTPGHRAGSAAYRGRPASVRDADAAQGRVRRRARASACASAVPRLPEQTETALSRMATRLASFDPFRSDTNHASGGFVSLFRNRRPAAASQRGRTSIRGRRWLGRAPEPPPLPPRTGRQRPGLRQPSPPSVPRRPGVPGAVQLQKPFVCARCRLQPSRATRNESLLPCRFGPGCDAWPGRRRRKNTDDSRTVAPPPAADTPRAHKGRLPNVCPGFSRASRAAASRAQLVVDQRQERCCVRIVFNRVQDGVTSRYWHHPGT